MRAKQLDRQKALHWLGGDQRLFAKVTTIFLKNIPAQVESLKGFIEADNNGSAERAAHTIMGSSAMMGAAVMSEEAGAIERSAMEGDMDSARLHFARFVEAYEKVMAELVADGEES